MVRGLALTASLLLAAVPVHAQTHAGSHDRSHPHDQPGHGPVDPAVHAALHALMHGSWTGTTTSAQGTSSGLTLTVAPDGPRSMTLRMSLDRPARSGSARDLVVRGDTLRWTQELSGAACKATAIVSPATAAARETMRGTMACEHDALDFTLQKQG